MRDNTDFLKSFGAVVDIGNDKTEIGLFNKGLMIDGVVIPKAAVLPR